LLGWLFAVAENEEKEGGPVVQRQVSSLLSQGLECDNFSASACYTAGISGFLALAWLGLLAGQGRVS
jgi:hypothetical protein